MSNKEIWTDGSYLGLFEDGTIGISDGVGFVGMLNKETVNDLYKALKKLNKKTLKTIKLCGDCLNFSTDKCPMEWAGIPIFEDSEICPSFTDGSLDKLLVELVNMLKAYDYDIITSDSVRMKVSEIEKEIGKNEK